MSIEKGRSAGQISLDLVIDTSKITSAVTSAGKKISHDLEKSFTKIPLSVENSTKNSIKEINEFDQKINTILNNAEKTARSKAASIASIYKRSGLDASESMKKAWEIVNQSTNKQTDSISDSVSDSAKKISSSYCNSFKKIAATAVAAFSVKAIINFGKECVESAASINASNAQFSQTFGDLQGTAEAAMKRVADSSGIIQTRLQDVGTSVYAFAKTSGMDSANALTMMEEALEITADSAAYYDRSLEDTAESLKSFLKGNYANDAALGLACTETTRNAAANKLYGTSFINLSEAQKQLTLLQMVKDANKLSGAMGQAAREADGWENVTGNLKETLKQFLAVIGQPILKTAVKIIQKITSYIQIATNSLKEIFGWSSNNALSSAMSNTADSTGEFNENLENSLTTAKQLEKTIAGFDQLNILSQKSDETSDTGTNNVGNVASNNVLADSINAVETELSKTTDSLNRFKVNFDKVLKKIKELTDSKGFKNLKASISTFVKNAGPDMLGIVGDLVSFFTDLINLNWNGLISDVESFTGHIISLGGDSSLAIATALFGEDSHITKNVKKKLDNYKNALEEYGLFGGIASFLRDHAEQTLKEINADPITSGFLTKWFDNCYVVFTKNLKKNNLDTALTNTFRYALNTSGPIIEATIVSWGNKIIGVINGIIDTINKSPFFDFKKIEGNLKLSKSTYNYIKTQAFLGNARSGAMAGIPKFASGGIVRAPTLALVGDNTNARNDPEIISPLSKLKGMVNNDDKSSYSLDISQILMMLERLCTLIENQENTYENNIYLDSEKIERQFVKIRKRKVRRYGGAY